MSLALFAAVLALVGLERVLELRRAARNARLALARGGREHGAGHYPFMRWMHASFFLAALAEAWLLDRPFHPLLAAAMLAVVCLTMALRYWVVLTLGSRWNTRVIVVPGDVPATGGPFRWVRHPNYVAVVLELAALPMVHTAWLTALAYTAVNLVLLLGFRIPAEDEALEWLAEGEES